MHYDLLNCIQRDAFLYDSPQPDLHHVCVPLLLSSSHSKAKPPTLQNSFESEMIFGAKVLHRVVHRVDLFAGVNFLQHVSGVLIIGIKKRV